MKPRNNLCHYLDWAVIAVGIVGIVVAIYLQTLRHP